LIAEAGRTPQAEKAKAGGPISKRREITLDAALEG
jgi:hypothetical protein